MDNKPSHVFRCEIYGQYINVRKTNKPVQFSLAVLEIIVNAEPTSKSVDKELNCRN